MNFLDKIFLSVNKFCGDDNACTMIIFVAIGFMLCYLFRNHFEGYVNLDNFHFLDEKDNNVQVNNPVNNTGGVNSGNQQIGIELNKKFPEPTPSTKRQLDVVSSMRMDKQNNIVQTPGLNIQDSMIFRPFDEIWNPGFMPLDMVFKNVQATAKKMIPDFGPSVDKGVGTKPVDGKPMKELKIILVYAPWCGHSKKMLPDYERVKNEFDGTVVNGNKVSIIMYNSDVDKDKVKEYGVKGFPTLFVEKNGVKESFPHRTYDKIVEYIKSA